MTVVQVVPVQQEAEAEAPHAGVAEAAEPWDSEGTAAAATKQVQGLAPAANAADASDIFI